MKTEVIKKNNAEVAVVSSDELLITLVWQEKYYRNSSTMV